VPYEWLNNQYIRFLIEQRLRVYLPSRRSVEIFEFNEPGGDDCCQDSGTCEHCGKNVPSLLIEHISKGRELVVHLVHQLQCGVVLTLRRLARHFDKIYYQLNKNSNVQIFIEVFTALFSLGISCFFRFRLDYRFFNLLRSFCTHSFIKQAQGL